MPNQLYYGTILEEVKGLSEEVSTCTSVDLWTGGEDGLHIKMKCGMRCG